MLLVPYYSITLLISIQYTHLLNQSDLYRRLFWYSTCVQELDVTWAQMEFGHEVHQRTSLKLISASEELIETLEDNQVELIHVIHVMCTYIIILL